MAPQEKKNSVSVSPAAATSMILHAVQHPHDAVHGVLLGSFAANSVKVSEAVPVCHGAPTQPVVETALSLIETSKSDSVVVVGWYVSPRLVSDSRPGPAALKIVSGLAVTDKEPVLVVVCNDQLDKVLKGEQGVLESSLKGLGKDFGKQWLEPLKLSVEDSAATAVQAAVKEAKPVADLVDHFEDDSGAASWYTFKK